MRKMLQTNNRFGLKKSSKCKNTTVERVACPLVRLHSRAHAHTQRITGADRNVPCTTAVTHCIVLRYRLYKINIRNVFNL